MHFRLEIKYNSKCSRKHAQIKPDLMKLNIFLYIDVLRTAADPLKLLWWRFFFATRGNTLLAVVGQHPQSIYIFMSTCMFYGGQHLLCASRVSPCLHSPVSKKSCVGSSLGSNKMCGEADARRYVIESRPFFFSTRNLQCCIQWLC